MKNKLLIVILLLVSCHFAQAQFTFSEALLINNENVDGPRSLVAADINGDGYLDIISASMSDNKIAWYRNTDGNGNFGSQQLVDQQAIGATAVAAADIDKDGDIDIIAASSFDNTIAWYENTDGNGSFSSKHIINTECAYATSVCTADIDSDGDIDVLSTSLASDEIVWYENTDGNGSFANAHLISNEADGAIFVICAHINQDNYIDVVAASLMDNKITWYQNTDGNGNFSSPHIICDSLDQARSVFAGDIDNDGFTDVLSASSADESIAWYRNIDGNGNFSNKRLIDNQMKGATSVVCADIDGDNDLDVLANAYNTNKIACYKNTNGNFSEAQYISETAGGVNALIVADLNGDAAIDIAAACEISDMLIWFANETPQDGIHNYTNKQLKCYPNPTTDYLYINPEQKVHQVTIKDISAKTVIETTVHNNCISISQLKAGVYFMETTSPKNRFVNKILKID